MREKIGIFLHLMTMSIKSQIEHRASFLMQTIAYAISSVVDISAIWLLFDRFHSIHGWRFEEVAIVYGVVHMGFSLAELSAKGFDHFSTLVRKGDFDRILLRPYSAILQIVCQNIQIVRLGRFFQGFIVHAWGMTKLYASIESFPWAILLMALLGVFALFFGLFIIQGALVFWMKETLELMNCATFGGVESGQYPMSIYTKTFRLFFTALIPLACVAYYPIAILLRHETLPILFAYLFPLAGMLFLLFALWLWKIGVKRYVLRGV